MKRSLGITLLMMFCFAFPVFSQVAFEDVPVAPTNYARSLFDAAHPDSNIIRIAGASDEDSSGVYNHDPFTVLFLHVENADADSIGFIVGVNGGITRRSTAEGFADTSKFQFTVDAVLDTITAAGNYRYAITITQAQHIYFTFDGYGDNNDNTIVTGDIVRRKYN